MTQQTPSQTHAVVMPKLGLTMTQATILEWYKQEGDWVEKGEPLFGLENEKATLEVEAPASGVLHILAAAGDTVPVLTLVAELRMDIGDAGQPASPDQLPGEGEPAADRQPAPSRFPSRLPPASPKARGLARQRGADLATMLGSGPRGMVVADDVAQAVAAPAQPAETATIKATPIARRLADEAGIDLATVAASAPGAKITRQDVERVIAGGRESQEVEAGVPPVSASSLPLTGLRAIIAERLTTGWQERPQVTLTTEADATNLVSARQQVIAELDEKVSYDAFLVQIVARALLEHPNVNARLTERGIERLAEINVGVAVDTERGLLVPVIHGAEGLELLQVQQRLRELADRALAGRSLPHELMGGTFTITNLGMFDIDTFTPIINPPEAAILGVGRIVNKPVGLNSQVVLRDMMTLSLSFDHRLLDGAPAARFLQRVKQLVERPFVLSLSMER
jgi:pyruvate dehydrogenase E2 component (dihydrolipoamide acetyltransferase)